MKNNTQNEFTFWEPQSRNQVLDAVMRLREMHRRGKLGGAHMPEDSNPGYPFGSAENYHYFSLPMALNYQRNSYRLWESAKMTAMDPDTEFVFFPSRVFCVKNRDILAKALLRYKLALQPNRHVDIWWKICSAIHDLYRGDIRILFRQSNFSVRALRQIVQIDHKAQFPYLSGEKICNYWLYVMGSYTDAKLNDREYLTVAPDTHVLQASVRLGIVSHDVILRPDARVVVGEAWRALLEGTGIHPIDIHTPLWLWSRGGFCEIERNAM